MAFLAGSVGGTATGEIDEGALIARLRAGDEAAFEFLVRTYGGRLLAVARRLVGAEDAQDVVQETFLSAYRSIDRFAGESRLSTWLHRIAVNNSLMKLRTRRRKPEEPIEELLPMFIRDGHQGITRDGREVRVESVEWTEPVDTMIERRETRAVVRMCIDQLPETYRTVLLLRDIEELDTEEAARVLGTSGNAVKLRLHRARQALRTLLDARFRGDQT